MAVGRSSKCAARISVIVQMVAGGPCLRMLDAAAEETKGPTKEGEEEQDSMAEPLRNNLPKHRPGQPPRNRTAATANPRRETHVSCCSSVGDGRACVSRPLSHGLARRQEQCERDTAEKLVLHCFSFTLWALCGQVSYVAIIFCSQLSAANQRNERHISSRLRARPGTSLALCP